MGKSRRYTDDDFILAVKKSFSYRGILVALGLRPTGGNYDCSKRRIKNLNCDISHFTFQAHNKGKIFGPKQKLSFYLVKDCAGKITSYALKNRLIKEGIKKHECENCQLENWLDKPISLELDHINGHHQDNRLLNLRLLCPNCHALTPTYRGKNRKNEDTRT